MSGNFADDQKLETYKSMISISVEGFKMLALLNGGAAAGILAAFDKIRNSIEPVHLKYGVFWFVLGLISVGCTFFGSYFTQFKLFEELGTGQNVGRHMIPLKFALAACVLSLLSFAVGAVVVATGIC